MPVPLYHYVEPITYRGKVAPNILARIQLPPEALQNRFLFHPYQVVDGDRPDTLAALYYGNDIYDWVVLLANKIINLRAEWPLTRQQFGQAITDKYGGLQQASTQITYYHINTNLVPIDQAAFSVLPQNAMKYYTRVASSNGRLSYGVTSQDIRINKDSFSILPAEEQVYWLPVSAYDDEFEVNESKRFIRLIDEQYVPQLEKNLKQISQDVIS